MQVPSEFPCISEGYCKNFRENFKQLALFASFRWLPIEGISYYQSTLILRIQVRFFLYISRLKSRRKLPPGKEKNGLLLAARRYDAEWVLSQINWCLQSLLLLLASIGFVIKSRLPLMSPSSLASIAFVMTGVLARLSISLSKHWDLVPTAVCLPSFHS